jgi:drug/metabolite transporter (DMT)-like permease
VFTALLAWLVFQEHFDARIATGMALITLGAMLAWELTHGLTLDPSAVFVAGACFA